MSARRRWHRARARLLATCLSLGGLAAFGCDGEGGPFAFLESGLDVATGRFVVELDLSRGVSESPPGMSLLSPARSSSLADLVIAIERAKKERSTKGFFVRLDTQTIGLAQAEELSRELAALPDEQPVTCHAHSYHNATLMLAAAGCDEIWLSPAGEVSSVGIAAQTVYVKRLLERFDVRTDFLHMGKYKSAVESLTRDGPSEPARASLLSVLRSLRDSWLAPIEASRGEKAVHAAEHGPWTPDQAVERGIVDKLGFLDEAREAAKKSAKVKEIKTRFGLAERRDAAEELSALLRSLAGTPSEGSGDARIALLPSVGGIRMSGGGPFEDDGIVARPLIKTLKRLREDDDVKAVVLRIDSPGGSALASDLIWHELMLLKAKKPLVASLASTAASGGYYMAAGTSEIVAERSSIIGSIGVFGGKVAIGGTLDQFGVSTVTTAASDEPGAEARATYLSPFSEWDDATRERVREHMQHVYDLFLSRVSEGRGMPVEAVAAVAEGRIWTGAQGLQSGLVDHLGGLREALDRARELADLSDDVPVKIERGPETLMELLDLDLDADEASVRAALARLERAAPGPFDALGEPWLSHLGGLEPLLAGERVLAAMPFALSVR